MDPLLVSARAALLATALALLTGVAAASWRARRKGRWLVAFDALCLLPMVLPPTVVGLALLYLFGAQSPLGQALQTLGWPVVFHWRGTVVAAFVVSFPLSYLMARTSFLMIHRELEDVIRLLGIKGWRRLIQIELPLAWPGIVAGGVLAFARALGEFGATLMLAGSIPGRTETLPIAIYFAAEGGELARAALYSILLSLVALLVAFAANRWGWRPTSIH